MEKHDTWESLCVICRELHLINNDWQTVSLGTTADIQARWTCPICRLVLCLLLPGSTLEPKEEKQPHSSSPHEIVLRKMAKPGFIIWKGKDMRGEINYLFPEDEVVQESPYMFPFKDGTREMAPILDYDLTQQWISDCDLDHNYCQKIHMERSLRAPAQTYFIDTFENCLLEGDTTRIYVALSYVWGNSAMFTTTSSYIDALKKPGGLLSTENSISLVIRDAMELSRRLGFRYLWVDALCIVQDDEIQQARLIAQMDSIYAQAYLTIIASSADNADCPLPGVRQGTRCKDMASIHVSPPAGTNAKVPNRYYTSRPLLPNALRTSSYDSRGWTFQESCLSRRCLIFTDYATFFHCDSQLKCEPGKIIPEADDWPERNLLCKIFEKRGPPIDSAAEYNLYTRLVFDFSERKLTFRKDSLKAISGILAVLSKWYGWKFIYGMPFHQLDHALLFRSSWNKPVRNPNFPSWSWAGWSNQVHWAHQSFWDTFYIKNEDIRDLGLIPLNLEVEIEPQVDTDESSEVDNLVCGNISKLQITGISASLENFSTKPGDFSGESPDQVPVAPCSEIWTTAGLRCGILFDSQEESYEPGSYKFLALSKSQWKEEQLPLSARLLGERVVTMLNHVCDDTQLKFSPFCFVNVLLIGVVDGKWERKGIGLIHEDVWRDVAKAKEKIVLH